MGCNGAECNCRFGITPEDSRLGQSSSLSLSLSTLRHNYNAIRSPLRTPLPFNHRDSSSFSFHLFSTVTKILRVPSSNRGALEITKLRCPSYDLFYLSNGVYIYRERQRIASRLASRIRRVVGNTRCLGIRLHHAKIYIYVRV